MKLRISVVSHSLVASRQALFFDRFGSATGNEVQQIYPLDWGQHHRSGGLKIYDAPGDLVNYRFNAEIQGIIGDVCPDVVYLQAEAYGKVAPQIMDVARHAHIMYSGVHPKFVIFVWENIREYEGESKHVIESADHVICGNKDAEDLVKKHNPKTSVLPQVGVDVDLFKPMDLQRQYDCLFTGRMVPEKGARVAQQAFAGTDHLIYYATGVPYHGMPKLYNRAKVHLTPSLDTPVWREQFMPYASLEALLCGCNIVASDSKSMAEWLIPAPGTAIVPQNDPEALRFATERFLADWKLNRDGMEWARKYFSCQAVSEKLDGIFRSLL